MVRVLIEAQSTVTLIDVVIAVLTVVTLIGVVAVRTLSSGSVEVKINDAIVAAIVAALMLFITGRIGKFEVSTSGVSVEATQAILKASAEPIINQVTSLLPMVPIDESPKGGLTELPALIGRHVQALDFTLGAGFYQGDAVKQYLESLTKYEFFRFVVLLNRDQTFVGIIDARKLVATLQDPTSGMNFESFAALINTNSQDALKASSRYCHGGRRSRP